MDDCKLLADIDEYIEDVWPDVVNDIASIVAIPSVADADKAEPGAPHGPEAHRALQCALGIGERLGLEPHDCEGWIGYADLKGASQKQIATIAHVDVVPAGTGWTQDAYTLTRREGFLMGRGVTDDKGPAILSLYMAHYFVRKGVELPYTLRVMLGSDEEVGMTDVEYYLEHYGQPAFLFTPDAEFPVCCGEKGRVSGSLVWDAAEGGNVVEFDGGTVSNAIPRSATALVRGCAADLPAAEGVEVVPEGEGLVRLNAHGIGGHASLPAGTINAIGLLVAYMRDNDLLAESEKPYFELLSLVFGSTDGSTLGIAATDDLFEPLTCIGGTMHLEAGTFVQTVDSRYPKSTTGAFIDGTLKALAQAHGARFILEDDMVPFYINPAEPAVKALVEAYNAVTGKSEKAFTIGGGTYARHFEYACSFGPEELGEPVPAWVGGIHGPDEAISEDLLKRSLKIYIYALSKLMELEF